MPQLFLLAALQWKYGPNGYALQTGPQGLPVIERWEVPGVPQPDEEELQRLLEEWEENTGGGLAIAKEQAKGMVNAMLEGAEPRFYQVLGKFYPEVEKKSFPRQDQEAAAFLADPAAPTPLLDAILEASHTWRGRKTELCQAIRASAAAMLQVTAFVIGKREDYQNQIQQAGSETDLTLVYSGIQEDFYQALESLYPSQDKPLNQEATE